MLWRILIFFFRFIWLYFNPFTIRWIFWAVSWKYQKQTHQQTHQPHRFITCFLKRFTQKIMADTNWNTKKITIVIFPSLERFFHRLVIKCWRNKIQQSFSIVTNIPMKWCWINAILKKHSSLNLINRLIYDTKYNVHRRVTMPNNERRTRKMCWKFIFPHERKVLSKENKMIKFWYRV